MHHIVYWLRYLVNHNDFKNMNCGINKLILSMYKVCNIPTYMTKLSSWRLSIKHDSLLKYHSLPYSEYRGSQLMQQVFKISTRVTHLQYNSLLLQIQTVIYWPMLHQIRSSKPTYPVAVIQTQDMLQLEGL